jgi:hypothetical protein
LICSTRIRALPGWVGASVRAVNGVLTKRDVPNLAFVCGARGSGSYTRTRTGPRGSVEWSRPLAVPAERMNCRIDSSMEVNDGINDSRNGA